VEAARKIQLGVEVQLIKRGSETGTLEHGIRDMKYKQKIQAGRAKISNGTRAACVGELSKKSQNHILHSASRIERHGVSLNGRYTGGRRMNSLLVSAGATRAENE